MNRELFRLDEISIRGLCLELLQSLWMILVIGVSLWLGITGVHTLIYEPAYTSTATLVVTVKGESSAYSSLSVTSQMADVFGEVFQSSALRSRIIEDVGEERRYYLYSYYRHQPAYFKRVQPGSAAGVSVYQFCFGKL